MSSRAHTDAKVAFFIELRDLIRQVGISPHASLEGHVSLGDLVRAAPREVAEDDAFIERVRSSGNAALMAYWENPNVGDEYRQKLADLIYERLEGWATLMSPSGVAGETLFLCGVEGSRPNVRVLDADRLKTLKGRAVEKWPRGDEQQLLILMGSSLLAHPDWKRAPLERFAHRMHLAPHWNNPMKINRTSTEQTALLEGMSHPGTAPEAVRARARLLIKWFPETLLAWMSDEPMRAALLEPSDWMPLLSSEDTKIRTRAVVLAGQSAALREKVADGPPLRAGRKF